MENRNQPKIVRKFEMKPKLVPLISKNQQFDPTLPRKKKKKAIVGHPPLKFTLLQPKIELISANPCNLKRTRVINFQNTTTAVDPFGAVAKRLLPELEKTTEFVEISSTDSEDSTELDQIRIVDINKDILKGKEVKPGIIKRRKRRAMRSKQNNGRVLPAIRKASQSNSTSKTVISNLDKKKVALVDIEGIKNGSKNSQTQKDVPSAMSCAINEPESSTKPTAPNGNKTCTIQQPLLVKNDAGKLFLLFYQDVVKLIPFNVPPALAATFNQDVPIIQTTTANSINSEDLKSFEIDETPALKTEDSDVIDVTEVEIETEPIENDADASITSCGIRKRKCFKSYEHFNCLESYIKKINKKNLGFDGLTFCDRLGFTRKEYVDSRKCFLATEQITHIRQVRLESLQRKHERFYRRRSLAATIPNKFKRYKKRMTEDEQKNKIGCCSVVLSKMDITNYHSEQRKKLIQFHSLSLKELSGMRTDISIIFLDHKNVNMAEYFSPHSTFDESEQNIIYINSLQATTERHLEFVPRFRELVQSNKVKIVSKSIFEEYMTLSNSEKLKTLSTSEEKFESFMNFINEGLLLSDHNYSLATYKCKEH